MIFTERGRSAPLTAVRRSFHIQRQKSGVCGQTVMGLHGISVMLLNHLSGKHSVLVCSTEDLVDLRGKQMLGNTSTEGKDAM